MDVNNYINVGWDFSDTDGDEPVWRELENWYPVLNWEDKSLIQIPDFTGMTISEVETAAVELGIVLIYKYDYYSEYPENYVCAQSAIGSALSGISVNIYISNGQQRYSGGCGLKLAPYKLSTADDLIALGDKTDDYDRYFILINDIDMSGNTFTDAVIASNERFNGNFNGDSYVISNLYIDSSNSYVGLFGELGSGADVSGVGLTDVDVHGNGYVGGLCGYNYYANISYCYVTGEVSCNSNYNIGGLCGRNIGGQISQCYSSVDVSGYGYYVGGICGRNENNGKLRFCYAEGSVSGNSNVGGLCGYLESGDICDCYSTAAVSGNSTVGGLCGNISPWNSSGITRAFWNIDTSGQDKSAGGWGLSNTEMMQASSFYGWNDGSWTIDEGNDYPHLAWENVTGQAIYTDYPTATYSGSGTEASPYELATADDLLCLMKRDCDWDKCFIMVADIDLVGYTFTNPVIGYGSSFSGSFDGDGYVISNLNIEAENQNKVGFFSKLDSSAEVSGLGLEKIIITGNNYVGGICGYNEYGTIQECYCTGTVDGSGDHTGGLYGYNNSYVQECYSSVDVTGNGYAGGLCGYCSGGSIQKCYSLGSVTGRSFTGGLCGYNNVTIEECYSVAVVTSSYKYAGSFCGYNGGEVTRSYWNTDQSGLSVSAGGWGLTDDEMKQASSYYGWGDGSWTIDEGNDYPHLAWENVTGQAIYTDYPTATYAGSGTEASPYELTMAEDLLCLMKRDCDWDKYFVLVNNIDLGAYTFENPVIGYGSSFSGSFNGDGHVISNLLIEAQDQDNVGFISRANGSTEIKNLGLENVAISGYYRVGSICGYNNGTIQECYSKGTVTGSDNTGGLCGESNGTIQECYSMGTVTGSDRIGGLCGYSVWYNIESSYSTANVSGQGSVGGLCGNVWYSSLNSCYAAGTVSGEYSVGGLCGYYYSNNDDYYVNQCYAVGEVTGNTETGGFLGYYDCGYIYNSFWDIETSGMSDGIGYSNSSNADITGLTTAQMQSVSNFTDAGWDFSASGDWKELADWYPVLSWEDVSLVTVPDLSGVSYTEAVDTLSSLGLAAILIFDNYSEYPENDICDQSVSGTVRSGVAVMLYVSNGNQLYSGGAGTELSPYVIATADDLVALGERTNDYDKYFIMTADIDMSGYSFSHAVIADPANDMDAFYGNFDGDGHVISNLNISGCGFCSLFGWLGTDAIVANLGLENVSVTSTCSYETGGLCGYIEYGSIVNCFVTGAVNGGNAPTGGICGYNWYGYISQCYSTCTLTSEGDYTGGVCGYNDYGIIEQCYSVGTVSSSGEYTGGLCGYNTSGDIIQCYVNGSVTGEDYYTGGLCGHNNYGNISQCYSMGAVVASDYYTGGLCGYNSGTIDHSYSCASVTSSNSYVGGVCGYNSSGSIEECYSVGVVTGSWNIGGLCGYSSGSTFTNCYWDVDTSGQDNSAGGRGLSNSEMKLAGSYLGWVDSSWTIDEGNDYPHQAWENAGGSIIYTPFP